MPNRLLRESINDSEAVNRLSPLTELFYRRLMSAVDDWGRFDARPTVLRSRLFPLRPDSMDDGDVFRWLNECEAAGLVTRYEANGKPYLIFHKLGAPRSKDSKWPDPPPEIACAHLRAAANGGAHERPGSGSGSETGSGSGSGQEGSGEPAKPASPPPADPGEVMRFPVVGDKHRSEWVLTHGQVAEYRECYPGLDVLAECRKALAWIRANPDRRKTARGMGRFLVTWLNRTTDRGGRPPAVQADPATFASQVFDLLVAAGTPPPVAGPYAEWAGRLARVVGWSKADAAARAAEWFKSFAGRRVTTAELDAAVAELAARKEPLRFPGDVLPAINASVARGRAAGQRAAYSPKREDPVSEEERAEVRRKAQEARARIGRPVTG